MCFLNGKLVFQNWFNKILPESMKKGPTVVWQHKSLFIPPDKAEKEILRLI